MFKKSIKKKFSSFSMLRYIILFFLALMVFHQPVSAQNKLSRDEIDRISRSVVQVIAPDGTGSGSIVNGSNLVYTNRHVAEGFTEFTIAILIDPNKPAIPTFKAELVSFSGVYDLAVLKITTDMGGREVTDEELRNGYGDTFKGFPVLTYAPHDQIPGRGDEIALLGYPGIGDGEMVYTKGIISSMKFDNYLDNEIPVWYRTTAEMSVGNSGGIAINENGEIIGLPTYVRMESETGGRLGNILAIQLVEAIVKAGDFLHSWEDFNESLTYDGPLSRLDQNLTPTYGEQDLPADASPIKVAVTSGGEIKVANMGENCSGFISAAPDYRLNWTGNSSHLHFKFAANEESKDATLLVKLPDGGWACNDDAYEGTLNPTVTVENPIAGPYNVWVGSYNDEEFIEGNLFINDGSENTELVKVKNQNESLDYSLEPYFGTMKFESGFTPDPFHISGQSGGDIDIKEFLQDGECVGFASKAPDFRLHWTGSTTNLKIIFQADSSEQDPVLIINTPDGNWKCNDNANENTLNPMIILDKSNEGQFDIWIGSHNSDEFINGSLIITEKDSNL
jgi:S1-C subfamily serine protease